MQVKSILSTLIKLAFVIKIFVLSFLSSRFRQVTVDTFTDGKHDNFFYLSNKYGPLWSVYQIVYLQTAFRLTTCSILMTLTATPSIFLWKKHTLTMQGLIQMLWSIKVTDHFTMGNSKNLDQHQTYTITLCLLGNFAVFFTVC